MIANIYHVLCVKQLSKCFRQTLFHFPKNVLSSKCFLFDTDTTDKTLLKITTG